MEKMSDRMHFTNGRRKGLLLRSVDAYQWNTITISAVSMFFLNIKVLSKKRDLEYQLKETSVFGYALCGCCLD